MRSIRRRLSLFLLSGLLLVLGGGGLALYLQVRAALRTAEDGRLEAAAWSLLLQLEEEDEAVAPVSRQASMAEFERPQRPSYFLVLGPDGAALRASAQLDAADLRPPAAPAGSSPEATLWDLSLPDGRPGRAVALPFALDSDLAAVLAASATAGDAAPAGSPSIPALLVVARDREDTLAVLRILRWSIAGVLLASMVLCAFLVMATLHGGLAPLDRLGAQAAAIQPHSLDVRFPAEQLPAELQPLALRLNDLLARLQEAFGREQRLTTAVAHELRTPIAELRTLCEVALRWPEDGAAAVRALQEALEIALQMQRLAAALLAQRRAEGGHMELEREPVDPARLIEELWQAQRASAAERGVRLALDLDGLPALFTDRALLRSLLANLLANAIEYSPAGALVECRGRASAGKFTLEFSNPSDALEPADLERLFEPFWRKDAARSGPHHGLGLALARAFAAALGMELRAVLEPPRVRFVLSGPLGYAADRKAQ